MKRILILLPMLLVGLSVSGQESNPYRFGYFAANMKPETLAAVLNAATTGGRQPWALFAAWGGAIGDPQTLAFYPPHTSTDRVRRGFFRTFRCSSTPFPNECLDWEPVGRPRNYAQIAEKGASPKSLRPRSPGEKPITLAGAFSDADLVSLAEYVRANRGPRQAFAMCGDDPISQFKRNRKGTVRVILSADSVGGCRATMRQTASEWSAAELGFWVS